MERFWKWLMTFTPAYLLFMYVKTGYTSRERMRMSAARLSSTHPCEVNVLVRRVRNHAFFQAI